MYIQGKTDDEDLFDLASLVSGIREELRWKQSLAKDEKMRNLIAEVSINLTIRFVFPVLVITTEECPNDSESNQWTISSWILRTIHWKVLHRPQIIPIWLCD